MLFIFLVLHLCGTLPNLVHSVLRQKRIKLCKNHIHLRMSDIINDKIVNSDKCCEDGDRSVTLSDIYICKTNNYVMYNNLYYSLQNNLEMADITFLALFDTKTGESEFGHFRLRDGGLFKLKDGFIDNKEIASVVDFTDKNGDFIEI